MISALKLKDTLETFDKNTPLLDYNVWCGFLPAIILFPLFMIVSNNTQSLILHSPFLFGLGFAGFFAMSLVLITSGLILTHFTLTRYIIAKEAIRRFNANSVLSDDSLVAGIANKIWESIKIHRTHDPLYQADLEAIRTHNDDKIKDLRTEFNDKIEDIVRAYRIRTLAWEKERNLGKQTRRERDYERQLNQKLTRLVITLSKIIINLKVVIKKLKGE